MQDRLSTFFRLEEFQCKCGTCASKSPHPDLVKKLDILRSAYGQPIIITSGLRCEAYNALVGGVQDSEHITGEAVDIACPDSTARYRLLETSLGSRALFNRIGIGKTFLHLGVSRINPGVIWTYYK